MGPKPDDRCSTCGVAGTRGEAVAFHTPRPPRPRAGRPGRGRPQPQGEHSLPTPLSRRPGPGRGWGHGSVREPPPPRHLLWQPPAERTAVVRPDAGAGPRPGHCPQGQRPRRMDKTAPPRTHALRQDRAAASECSMAPREALSASHVRAPREALSWRPGAAATPDGPGSARRSRRQTAPHHWTDTGRTLLRRATAQPLSLAGRGLHAPPPGPVCAVPAGRTPPGTRLHFPRTRRTEESGGGAQAAPRWGARGEAWEQVATRAGRRAEGGQQAGERIRRTR